MFIDETLEAFAAKNDITREAVSLFIRKKEVSPSMLRYFERTYPEVNMEWILKGKGDYFKNKVVEDANTKIAELKSIIAQQAKTMSALSAHMEADANPNDKPPASDEQSQVWISHIPGMSSGTCDLRESSPGMRPHADPPS